MAGKGEVIVAVDMRDAEDALSLVSMLMPEVSMFKVGMELFYSAGPGIIDRIVGLGAKVFCDLKLHDVPTTVGRAASVLTKPGVSLIDVHAPGGSHMMKEAARSVRESAAEQSLEPPAVIGVTLLTSMDRDVFQRELGLEEDLTAYVVRMARLAKECGLDGVVTSAFEVRAIREACGDEFITVVPGVRPAWAGEPYDQKRFASPREAVLMGADYLVIGRPITQAESPRDAALAILEEIEEASRHGR